MHDVVLGVDGWNGGEGARHDPHHREVGVHDVGLGVFEEGSKGAWGSRSDSASRSTDQVHRNVEALQFRHELVFPGERVGDVVFEGLAIPVAGAL
jgi:hypothetical protein